MKFNKIYQGHASDVLKTFPDNFVNTVITSPPYWGLRDYGVDGQLGLESTPEEYVQNLVEVFREVKRVLRDDGTLWLNLGDSYAGSGKGAWDNPVNTKEIYSPKSDTFKHIPKTSGDLKPKDLVGIPWMVAFALRADGWYLRSDIIWHKPNAMPESVTDRPTNAHEYIFLFSKSRHYYYDHEAIKEVAVSGDPNPPRGSEGVTTNLHKGRRQDKKRGSFNGKYGDLAFRAIRSMRNKRSVWTVTTKPLKEAHFATFPTDLIEPCVLAGSPKKGVVLDPFIGSGTTGLASLKHGRDFIGIDLNPEYIKIAEKRLKHVQLELV